MPCASTYSLPCTCDLAADKVIMWTEKEVLSRFLHENIKQHLYCRCLHPVETPRGRKGTEGHWLAELMLKSGGPLTGEEDFIKAAARALSGVVQGYGTSAVLIKIPCNHLHPGHMMCKQK